MDSDEGMIASDKSMSEQFDKISYLYSQEHNGNVHRSDTSANVTTWQLGNLF